MAIREILTYPDAFLKQKSKPVEKFDDELASLVDDMQQTMYAAPGIGLAAIQVGVPLRLLVLDIDYEWDNNDPAQQINKNLQVFVNPVITHKEGSMVFKEGCLSVPEFYEEVKRAQKIRLEYQDVKGLPHTLEAEDLLAVCLQHEIDHLEGRLFIDRLSFIKAKQAKKKLKKNLADQR